jgi:hypothetical protein
VVEFKLNSLNADFGFASDAIWAGMDGATTRFGSREGFAFLLPVALVYPSVRAIPSGDRPSLASTSGSSPALNLAADAARGPEFLESVPAQGDAQ